MEDRLNTIIKLFQGKKIRSVLDSEKEGYYFSVIDVIRTLINDNYDKTRNY